VSSSGGKSGDRAGIDALQSGTRYNLPGMALDPLQLRSDLRFVTGGKLLLQDCEIADPLDLSDMFLGKLTMKGVEAPRGLLLANAKLSGDILIENCRFLKGITATGIAVSGSVTIRSSCELGSTDERSSPSCQFEHSQISRSLKLENGVTFFGPCVLNSSKISGGFTVQGCVFHGDGASEEDEGIASEASLNIEGIEITGDLVLKNLQLNGAVNARRIVVTGNFSIDGGTFAGLHGISIRTDKATIFGDTILRNGAAFGGTLEMRNMVLGGNLALDGIRARGLATDTLPNLTEVTPSLRPSVELSGSTVQGHLLLQDGSSFSGTIRAAGVQVHGNLAFDGVILGFSNQKSGTEASLMVDNSIVDGDFFIQENTVVHGYLSARNIRIAGDMAFDGSKVLNRSPNGETPSVNLDAARIGGRLTVHRNSHICGPFQSKIGQFGAVLFTESSFASNDVYSASSIRFENTNVSGDVVFRDVNIQRGVVLARCNVSGQLDFLSSSLSDAQPGTERLCGKELNQNAIAISVEATTVGKEIKIEDRILARSDLKISLRRSRCVVFQLDPSSPGWVDARLDGFEYSSVGSLDDSSLIAWSEMEQWVTRPVFSAGIYKSLSNAYRDAGQVSDSEQVTIKLRRREREQKARVRRIGGWAIDKTSGYGFHPEYAAAWMLLCITLLTIAFASLGFSSTMRASSAYGPTFQASPSAKDVKVAKAKANESLLLTKLMPSDVKCGSGTVTCFDPALYSLDTFVPLLDLGQRSTWHPDTGEDGGTAVALLLSACTVVGWLLTSLFLLSFARLQRQEGG
jgi:cytoskeletal protein CcmA (bactofilin family)